MMREREILQNPDAQFHKETLKFTNLDDEITADANRGMELEEIGLGEEDLTCVEAELTNLALR